MSEVKQELFAVVCGQPDCERRIKVLPGSITHVLFTGDEATVTVDLSPMSGRETTTFCDRSDCATSFGQVTTNDPAEVAWLTNNVVSERCVQVALGVAVLRPRGR
jgi:hypothetical protein